MNNYFCKDLLNYEYALKSYNIFRFYIYKWSNNVCVKQGNKNGLCHCSWN